MDLVARAAQKYGGKPALVTEKTTYSFRDLDATTAGLAAVLQGYGIGKGDVIALSMPNSPGMVLLLLALLKTGSIAAPLNHRFPVSRLQELLHPLEPVALVGPKDMTENLSAPMKLDPETVLAESSSAKERSNDFNSSTAQQLDRPVTIIHTSSSSGKPKAALHSFGNHYYSALGSNENIPFDIGDCWLLSLPLFHIGGYALLFRSLLGGGALVVMESNISIAEALGLFGITHLSLVPTQLYRVLGDNTSLTLLQKTKAILLGGSAVEPALLKEAAAAKLPVYLSYGSTEMSSQITTTSSPANIVTAGSVLPYRELTIGTGDEILVKGPCLFQGYLAENGPVLETDNRGWFHTGDTGALSPEGKLQVTGRTDNMFISGGENIHPEEIERALGSLPGILRAIVVPIPDPEYGLKPKAFIETTGEAPTDKEIREKLSREIGKFKTPVAITRVQEWSLLPGTEKIDKGHYKHIIGE